MFIMVGPDVTTNVLCAMPDPYDKIFLHFKGKYINSFLSKYKYCADHAHLMDDQRCEELWWHFSKRERRYLEILDGYWSHNWSQLKDKLWSAYTLLLYPALLPHYTEEIELTQGQKSSSKFEVPRVESSHVVEMQVQDIPELVSLLSSCYMCGESYHSIHDCLEAKFLIALGICYLDMNDQVAMSDGSVLPQAGEEGGVAQVIRERETRCTATLVLDSFDSGSFSSTLDSDYEDAAEPAILSYIEIHSASAESEILFTSSDDELPELMETSPESLMSTESLQSMLYSIYSFSASVPHGSCPGGPQTAGPPHMGLS